MIDVMHREADVGYPVNWDLNFASPAPHVWRFPVWLSVCRDAPEDKELIETF